MGHILLLCLRLSFQLKLLYAHLLKINRHYNYILPFRLYANNLLHHLHYLLYYKSFQIFVLTKGMHLNLFLH